MVSTLFTCFDGVSVRVPSSTYCIRDDIVGIIRTLRSFVVRYLNSTGRSDEHIRRGGSVPPFCFLGCFLFFFLKRNALFVLGREEYIKNKQFSAVPRSIVFFFSFFPFPAVNTCNHTKSLAKHYTLITAVLVLPYFKKRFSSLHRACEGVHSSSPLTLVGTYRGKTGRRR